MILLFTRRCFISTLKKGGREGSSNFSSSNSSSQGAGSTSSQLKNLKVNDQIRAQEVRLLNDMGNPYGIVTLAQAKIIAQSEGLDLVEISPNATPPVVKVIDFGKYKYQLQRKAAEAKKKQVVIDIKEIKFRPHIEKHDLEVKMRNILKFLEEGDKVKMLMQFRGRELMHKEIGLSKFEELIKLLVDGGAVVESPLKMMGNRAIVMLAPGKKK